MLIKYFDFQYSFRLWLEESDGTEVPIQGGSNTASNDGLDGSGSNNPNNLQGSNGSNGNSANNAFYAHYQQIYNYNASQQQSGNASTGGTGNNGNNAAASQMNNLNMSISPLPPGTVLGSQFYKDLLKKHPKATRVVELYTLCLSVVSVSTIAQYEKKLIPMIRKRHQIDFNSK